MAAPLFKVRFAVKSAVPPEKVMMLALVMPSALVVPPFWIKDPFALTVISPDAVKTPPVVTVSVAPERRVYSHGLCRLPFPQAALGGISLDGQQRWASQDRGNRVRSVLTHQVSIVIPVIVNIHLCLS